MFDTGGLFLFQSKKSKKLLTYLFFYVNIVPEQIKNCENRETFRVQKRFIL